MRSSKMMIPLALMTLAVLSACQSGCTALGNLATPAANPLVQVAVDVAVAQVVGQGTDAHAKAGQISQIAQQVLALDQGDSVAITAIDAAINAKLASLKLPPADALAAQALTQTLEALIQQRLAGGTATTPAGTVTSQAKVEIALVLQDVISACAVY